MVRRSLLLSLLLLLCVSLVGCSRIPFISSRYDNFTAYYNTFYNAKKAYDQGIEALERQDQPIDRDRYLPIFTTPDRVSSTRDFDAAIRKSADVLRDHPESKWVDDALLLIGKSYFYLQNYVGAEQKFQEVVGLGTSLEDEARFWLARTLIASGSYEAAAEHLRLSLNREDLSDRWEPMLRLALGELYVQREAWTEAAAELEDGLSRVRDKELGGRAQFLLGQVYETLGEYGKAVDAYRRVGKYRPLYELSYAAQVSAIRVEGRHGDPERALRDLRRMERDDKNYTNRAELAYLRGRVYQAMGLADDAFYTYDELLYDPDPNVNITAIRGRAHYALGELYRDAYKDFMMASAHFDTAATALRSGGGGAQGARVAADIPAPEAIRDADEQAEVFKTFADMALTVSDMDSLLYLGSLEQEEFDAFLLDLRKARAEELAEQQRELERQQAQQRFQNSAAMQNNRAGGTPALNAANTGSGEAGFLFHNDPARVQEGRVTFINRWGNRPLVPNWRREEAVAAAVDEGLVAEGADALEAGAVAADPNSSLPQIDISAVPRDSLSQAQMRADRAMARYELGNVLFLSMARPDSAAAWYRMVIEEDQDQPVAQRAYYALAEVQRALGDTLAAERLDQHILNAYPDSELARRLRAGTTRAAATPTLADSLAEAERAYAAAYRHWQQEGFAAALNEVLALLPWYLPPVQLDEDYKAALNDMLGVAARYQSTEVAPRAMLAAGTIYMEWARHDGLDLFGNLPLQLPDSLLEQAYFIESSSPVDSLAADSLAAAADEQPSPGSPAFPDDSTAVTPAADSLAKANRAPAADSLAKASRTLVADSLALADSSLVADSLVADSLAVPGVPASADSLSEATGPLPSEGGADSLAAREKALNLEALYERIVSRYPKTPQAERAQKLLQALENQRTAIRADSLALADSLARMDSLVTDAAGMDSTAVVTDSLVTDSTGFVGDSLEVAEQGAPDSLAASPAAEGLAKGDVPPTAAAPDSVRADAAEEAAKPVKADPEKRTITLWTIVVASEEAESEATVLAEKYRDYFTDQGYPAVVYPAETETGTRYRVGVGRFSSEREADGMRMQLGQRVPKAIWPDDSWVMPVEVDL